MNTPRSATPESKRFESGLRREMVKTELSRINIVAILSGVMTVYILILDIFFPQLLRQILGSVQNPLAIWLSPVGFVLLLAYALIVRGSLVKSIAAGREASTAYRFGTAAFEAVYPSALILVMGTVMDPIFLLISPVLLLYCLFIFSTTLQMDPRVPIFSSLLACGGYLAAYFWFRERVDPGSYPVWLIAPNSFAGRSLSLLLCGMISSFLAWQIRKRVLHLAAATEEKNNILHTFGQHVSPRVVDRLLTQKKKLSSEMRHVCILFLDIRNFTTLSENRSPGEVVEILNQLFTFMIDITNRNEGIINKFLGDGFMAVFGAPFSGGDDCKNAVKAAREILERLEEENRSTGRDIAVGMGLHAGEALTGDVGSVERKEYTIMGDVVNVASRIESLNKTYGSRVLLSREVRDLLPPELQDLEDLGPVKVKGREGEVRIFKMA